MLLPPELRVSIFRHLSKTELLICRFLSRDYQISLESVHLCQQIWHWRIALCILVWKDSKSLSENGEFEAERAKFAGRDLTSPGWKILLEMVKRKQFSVDNLRQNMELSVQRRLI